MHRSQPSIVGHQEVAQGAGSFFGLGIAPGILEILEHLRFKIPTPIQHKVIPLAINGQDVIGIAQTGTGKTHAFAIPLVQRLAQIAGVGLILAPTRELAIQIFEALEVLTVPAHMPIACLIGGAPMEPQTQALRKDPRIVVATPGRLIDHMGQWNFIPDTVSILVLDEADRMLDMGFAPQIERIFRFLPKNRQTMLFSATMPKEILEMTAHHMKLPVSIEIAPPGTVAERVTQELYVVKKEDKPRLLGRLLSNTHGSVLLFCRTRYEARKVTRAVRNLGQRVAEIHSDRTLEQRREALDGFKTGKYRVLVATDIAARGIDVTGIEYVINYDIPEDAESYVHRIGRTARAGLKGRAISFAMPDQSKDVQAIEKLIRGAIPVVRHPDFPVGQFVESDRAQPKRSAGGRFQGHRKLPAHSNGRLRQAHAQVPKTPQK